MPISRFNRIFDIARSAKAFLNSKGETTCGNPPSAQKRRVSEQREKIESKRQEFKRIGDELRAAKGQAEIIEHKKRKRIVQQEIFQLRNELRAAREQRAGSDPNGGRPAPRAAGESKKGTLPDFVIIGAKKSGTTSLYRLLIQHPHVEPAAAKELHFFDTLYEEGVEWYRQCFPPPRLKDGRQTVTGEATPYYLYHPHAARRMAEVVPQARLIALLRNPVDRAYSDYHHLVRSGREHLAFEEAIEAEEERLRGESEKMLEDEHYVSPNHQHFSYLARGLYADQLMRWSEFFDNEQMLVLKSEDFFKRPREGLKAVLDFLDLPEWEPESWGAPKKGGYEGEIDPKTRRRLEEYFEPHNQKLYEYLGTDFGW